MRLPERYSGVLQAMRRLPEVIRWFFTAASGVILCAGAVGTHFSSSKMHPGIGLFLYETFVPNGLTFLGFRGVFCCCKFVLVTFLKRLMGIYVFVWEMYVNLCVCVVDCMLIRVFFEICVWKLCELYLFLCEFYVNL